MAVFTNQATLTYSGGVTASNIVTGEITETVAVSKLAVSQSYTAGDELSYSVTIVNSGDAAVTGVTVSDDLGAFELDGATLYPLSYVDSSVIQLVNGAPAAAPTVTAGPPLVFSDIEVPAGGSVTLIYEARVTAYAPMGEGAEIVNTVSVTGSGIAEPVTAGATVPMEAMADLSITKAMSPDTISDGEELTYTFLIQNTGALEAGAADNVTLTDTFQPALSGIAVTLNGAALSSPADYTYDEATGVFATVPGKITVPAAAFERQPDGTYVVTPGTAELTVTGTI